MAVNEIYGIYDEATEAFVQFLPAVNEKIARMTIEKLFKEKRFNVPLLFEYPNNFKVLHLGSFNDNTGVFVNSSHQDLLLDFGSLVDCSDTHSPSSVGSM